MDKSEIPWNRMDASGVSGVDCAVDSVGDGRYSKRTGGGLIPHDVFSDSDDGYNSDACNDCHVGQPSVRCRG